MVRALYFSVSCLIFFVTRSHEEIIPITIPITDQNSPRPIAMAAPGKANNSQADSPDALSENAVTHGPNDLPANK